MASVLFLFIFGFILALAASPPLAERNNLDAFHYVHRQAVFGGLALLAMTITSMMSVHIKKCIKIVALCQRGRGCKG